MLVFDALGKVYKHLVVVLQSLTVGEDDVFSDLLLGDFVLVCCQKILFDFVESFFVQRLTRH